MYFELEIQVLVFIAVFADIIIIEVRLLVETGGTEVAGECRAVNIGWLVAECLTLPRDDSFLWKRV